MNYTVTAETMESIKAGVIMLMGVKEVPPDFEAYLNSAVYELSGEIGVDFSIDPESKEPGTIPVALVHSVLIPYIAKCVTYGINTVKAMSEGGESVTYSEPPKMYDYYPAYKRYKRLRTVRANGGV